MIRRRRMYEGMNRRRRMYENETSSFFIYTGSDKLDTLVLKNVLGQLSDGLWENDSRMDHYWPYVNIAQKQGYGCIEILDTDSFDNWFSEKLNLDESSILVWFAQRIKDIVVANAEDYPEKGISFSPRCNVPLDYMYANDREITAADAYRTYTNLMSSAKNGGW